MSLKARITEDMKAAMRAGEKDRLSCIRMLQAGIQQREVDFTGSFILAANHHNYLDGVVLGVAVPRPIAFLVMPRVFQATPLHPPFHRRIGSIPVALERPDPGAIERIDVDTYRFAANMREPDPANYFAAKYSLPHAAAALIVRGNAGYHAFTEAAVRDPAIAALRRREPAHAADVERLRADALADQLADDEVEAEIHRMAEALGQG